MMKEKLIELDACAEALEWAGDKTWEEIYNTCHRGDWLLWLFAKTNPNDFRLLALAKAHCANTFRHSAYHAAGAASYVIAVVAFAGAAVAGAFASVAGACSASTAGAFAAAFAAAYVSGSATAYFAAKEENQKLTADVCRKYLPIEIWNV
jgi:hypothetical protein